MDLDEEGLGDIDFEATHLVASGNVDEGIKASEDVETEAGGGIEVQLHNVPRPTVRKTTESTSRSSGPAI
jgi:hypothetical protein